MKLDAFNVLGASCLLFTSSANAFLSPPKGRALLKPSPSGSSSILPVQCNGPKSASYRKLGRVRSHESPLFSATLGNSNSSFLSMVQNDVDGENSGTSIRKELGQLTGLSITVIRASVRATTGLSITAMRTFLRTLTGVSVTGTMKALFGLLPPWARYFLQPFLIMYYAPLVILKGLVGSTSSSKKDDRASHEQLVDYWKEAIQMAENRSASWPLHVMADGSLQYDLDDDRMNDAIVEAIEMKYMLDKKIVPPPS